MLIVINKETIIGWPCRQGKIVSDCQICQRGNFNPEVRATDENGLWSKSHITVMIQCLPAWYETGWAYLFYVLVVLSVVWNSDRMYLKLRESAGFTDCSATGTKSGAKAWIDPLSRRKSRSEFYSASDEQLIKKALDMVEKEP